MNVPTHAVKRSNWLALAQLSVLLALLIPALNACSRSDPEREVRSALAQMQTALEARDTSAFMGYVAEDFTRADESMNAKELRRLLTGLFLTQQKVSIGSTIQSLTLEGKEQDRASVKLNVIATGRLGSSAALIPDSAQTWEVTAALRREGRTWRVFNARLKPLL